MYHSSHTIEEVMEDMTVADFQDWIRAQPADDKIYHGCGWSKCAVGTFVGESIPTTIEWGSELADDILDAFTAEFSDWSEEAVDNLLFYDYLNHSLGDTYGDVVRFLDGKHDAVQEEFVRDMEDVCQQLNTNE